MHFSQQVNPRRFSDTRIRHLGFQFPRSEKLLRLFETLPLEKERQVIDISRVAENAAIALAMRMPPFKSRVESCFQAMY
jgi:hypothetical protein